MTFSRPSDNMRKIFLIYVICFLIIIEIAYSSMIEVGISEELKGNISSITYDNSSNIIKISIEFYNTGSIAYKTRVKVEFLDKDKVIFNAWSQEKEFMPGDKKSFDTYWYTNNTGNFFVRLKVYFGNEILEYEKFSFIVNKSLMPEDIFEVENFRTYDNYILFDVKSKEDVEKVIVMPDKYIPGWIFEQREIDIISKDSSKLVMLNYYPTLWMPSNISLIITSDKGKYYTERIFEMKKNKGLIGFFYRLVDGIRIALFS